MAKTKYLAWLLGLGLVLAAAWYFVFSAITPNGQPPLTRLTSENPFVTEFNRDATKVRMVLLLSPT
ncbi:MAG TPA: hypothetical protein VJ731_02355 [Terriglobales bacterium]|nr:hypothetical protein [Terriglobales bacterium]